MTKAQRSIYMRVCNAVERKRKSSKGEPCQTCLKLELECCNMDPKKKGSKPGALESLQLRVEQLESIVV